MTTSPNPSKAGIGLGAKDLVEVHIETHEGAEYVFPDMGLSILKLVLPKSGRVPEDQPSLALVNFSSTTIVIPFRVIKTIWAKIPGDPWENEVLWHSTA